MTHLQLDQLTKVYPKLERPAVDRLSLEINSGEIVAILGPSGCGKTSTLKMIAGLTEPTSGDILMDGTSVLDVPAERRNAVMVFQEHTLFPFMNVGRNIAFGLQMRGVGKREITRRVADMLDLVQLTGMVDRRPGELSGGQQQRVALARAIVTEPRLLLLDEPLANLDAHLRDEMRSLILSVQNQTNITTVLVTHDQEEAVLLAQRIALVFEGALHQYDQPVELFQHPRSHRAARFFGGMNFVPAVRKSAVAHTPLGEFTLDANLAPRMPDRDALLTIRPEHVRLGPPVESQPDDVHPVGNTVRGTLSSCIFVGTHTRCRIRVGDFEIEAIKSIDAGVPPEGGAVSLTFPPRHLWLCPQEAGRPVAIPAAPERSEGPRPQG